MKYNDSLFKKIEEVRYLAVDNTYRYRAIMRYFYNCYIKFTYWLSKEEVFNGLRTLPIFEDYTMELCMQDLETLKTWKSLNAVQDATKASSIEEFKNKSFRYQLTEYAIEIERMTVRLENLFVEGASLQPNLIEKIKNQIVVLHEHVDDDDYSAGSWWENLTADFKRLNQNYQDYIRDWQSVKADEMMKTKSFLIAKDKFIEYLRTFVKNLQDNSLVIEAYLRNLDPLAEESILKKIIHYSSNIPRVDFDEISEEEIDINIHGQWLSIKEWFIGSVEKRSEASKLFDLSNEIIRKITRFAVQLVETANHTANRKEEYRKISKLFNASDDDIHKLSAYVFGINKPRHIKGNICRTTESSSSSVFEEEAYEYILKPRIRSFREKMVRNPIKNTKEQQKALREKILKERKREEEIIHQYSKDGIVEFESLDKINQEIRSLLLMWLTKGLGNKNKQGKTENGLLYKVIEPENNKRCQLKCEDGMLDMPAFKLVFEKKGGTI